MTVKLLEGAGKKVTEQWLSAFLSSPLLFWVGGFLAIRDKPVWQALIQQFSTQPELAQLEVLVVSLSVAIASAFVVKRLEFPVLRGLEGYWYPMFNWVRSPLIGLKQEEERRLFRELAALDDAKPSIANDYQRSIVNTELSILPLDLEGNTSNFNLMPTRLGNILRAYERKPLEKYGLDTIVCWPSLWLLLPDSVQNDLNAARDELNAAVRLFTWSFLFLVWGRWAIWAVPVGLISAWIAYQWATSAAQTYGLLIEAAFDTHRHRLYESLRVPLPATSRDEPKHGAKLTDYLRGTLFPPKKITFTTPTE